MHGRIDPLLSGIAAKQVRQRVDVGSIHDVFSGNGRATASGRAGRVTREGKGKNGIAGRRPGLCRRGESGELAAQCCRPRLRTVEMSADVRDGRAYATGRDVANQSGQVVIA